MRFFQFVQLVPFVAAVVLLSGCTREAKKERLHQRAADYLQSGDYEAARIEYYNVLQADPNDVVALEKLALVWWERGSPRRALPYLLQVRALRPDDRATQAKALQIAFESGKLAEVRSGALELLERSPNHARAIMLLADAARSEADHEQARRALQTFGDKNSAAFHLATANLVFHRGEAGAARLAFQKAINAEPNSADAHSAMASFYLAQNDAVAAERALKTAFDLSPVRSNARLRYLEFNAKNGRVAEAVAGLKSMTEAAPDYFPAWRGLAGIAAAEGRYEAALSYLDKVFALDRSNLESRALRAQIWLAQGESDKAIGELERLSEEFQELADVQYELGRAYLQLKNPEKARASFREAIAQNPDHEAAILLWAGLSLRAGDAQAVVSAMAELLAKRPHLEQAQMLLMDALGALGRLDDIVNLLRESIRVSPQRPQAFYLLGRVLVRQEKLDDARWSFEKALELAPDSLPAFTELFQLDLRAGKYAEAERRVQQQLAAKPNSSALYLLAATSSAAQQDWEATEAAAMKALELGAVGLRGYELIVRSYLARGPRSEILERVEDLLTRKAGDVSAFVIAGDVYMQLKEFGKARQVYEECLSRHPDTLAALNNLAYLYDEHLSDSDRALELAGKARQLQPNSPEIADTLGWILFKRREYSRALQLMAESVSGRPDNPQIQFHFARASQMMGQTEKARDAYMRAAAAKVDFAGKSEIAAYLAELDQSAPKPEPVGIDP